jgi:iron complex outermembrane receptor protein
MMLRNVLMLVVAVHFQAALAAEDLFDLSLEELMQVPISGSTLIERSWQQTPSAVTVFSREQIQRLGVDYVEELMNLVPGFQRFRTAQNQINYVYSSRGRRVAEGAYDVLILVDGVTLHSPRSRSNAASHGLIPVTNSTTTYCGV